MVDSQLILGLVIGFAWSACLFLGVPFLGRRFRNYPHADRPPTEEFSLTNEWMRMQVQGLLARYGISGSAMIVDGRVLPMEKPGQRNHFGVEVRRAVETAMAATGQNPNLAIYTYREGKMVPLGNLCLADLLGLAMMLETTQ